MPTNASEGNQFRQLKLLAVGISGGKTCAHRRDTLGVNGAPNLPPAVVGPPTTVSHFAASESPDRGMRGR